MSKIIEPTRAEISASSLGFMPQQAIFPWTTVRR
jgi:hypothetical protein